MEPYQVPMALQKAFHLMRSGRPGPVLIDLPIDVQLAEIEFDIDAYEPLVPFKPKMTRKQAEKALAMLNEAERPLIVAGGGVINADASDLLIEFAEIIRRPGRPDADGLGLDPRRPSADGRHVRAADLAPLRQRDHARLRFRARHRQSLGQPPHRLGRQIHGRQEIHPHRHRADADRPRLRARLRRCLRCRRGAENAARRRHRMEGGGQAARLVGLGEGMPGAQEDAEAQDAFRRRRRSSRSASTRR